MKRYYLIADTYGYGEFNYVDSVFFQKFAEENDIALVLGAYSCWSPSKASPFSETEIHLILYRIIDFCDGVFVARSYRHRKLTKDLLTYAKTLGKEIRFASKQWKLRKEITEYINEKINEENEQNAN